MSTVISLINNSGGIGKTFIATNLGMTLAQKSKKVLLVDLNPQTCLSSNFSVKESVYTSYRAMVEGGKFVVNQLGDNLFIIPAEIDLVGCELELYNKPKHEFVLKTFLAQFKSHFDYILIDTPPGLGLLVVNALVASDIVIVPLIPEEKMFTPNKWLVEGVKSINAIRQTKALEIFLILNFCGSKIPSEQIKIFIESFYKTNFLKTNIYANYPLSEALDLLKKTGINPYEKFKPTPDFNKLALEIINLKIK